MGTPRQIHNPIPDREADRANALNLVESTAAKFRRAEAQRDAVIRYARDHGASLRQIADRVGISHATVRAICGSDGPGSEPTDAPPG